jgi:hypothetical protein
VIQMPRRSVTRFFIPLIDVMTLLFCIFLLMPIVEGKPAAAGGEDAARSFDDQDRQSLAALRQRIQELERRRLTEQEQLELEAIRSQKIEELQKRLAIHPLQIDPDTGRLFDYQPQPVEIASEADAHALIERQRQSVGGRDLYYLFLFPRKVTGYPLERQREQYERWFKGVAHGVASPNESR